MKELKDEAVRRSKASYRMKMGGGGFGRRRETRGQVQFLWAGAHIDQLILNYDIMIHNLCSRAECFDVHVHECAVLITMTMNMGCAQLLYNLE